MREIESKNLGHLDLASEYVVFADESGDHGLTKINSNYPIFALVFCIFRIDTYQNQVLPSLNQLKKRYFLRDDIILHERDIRKREGNYSFLQNEQARNAFNCDVASLISGSEFTVVACVIKKFQFRETGYSSDNPYRVAMEFGLERVFFELQERQQRGKRTQIFFESRGKREDQYLELEFRRVMDSTNLDGMADTLSFNTAYKRQNIAGHQIADLLARPIGLKVWKPEQVNRAAELALTKLRQSRRGEILGYGLKIIP